MAAGLLSACQPSGRNLAASSDGTTLAADSVKYEEQQSPSEEPLVADAAGVIRAYYRAIGEHKYREAYLRWASEGAASGKSFEAFQSGFSETASVEALLGDPGPVGAAAGSRYVEIPVRVVARLRSGARQEFAGTYTLRRSIVDGATPEQRAWRIHSAKLR